MPAARKPVEKKPATKPVARKPRTTAPKAEQPIETKIVVPDITIAKIGDDADYGSARGGLLLMAHMSKLDTGAREQKRIDHGQWVLIPTGIEVTAPDGFQWDVRPYAAQTLVQPADECLSVLSVHNYRGNAMLVSHRLPLAIAYLVEIKQYNVVEVVK